MGEIDFVRFRTVGRTVLAPLAALGDARPDHGRVLTRAGRRAAVIRTGFRAPTFRRRVAQDEPGGTVDSMDQGQTDREGTGTIARMATTRMGRSTRASGPVALARLLTCVLAAGALAACSTSPGETPKSPGLPPPYTPTPAEQLCQKSLPSLDVRSAGPMVTVGELRQLTVGPAATRPLADAFPGEAANTAGTYCWIATVNGFDGYAVSVGGTAVPVGSVNVSSPTPTGAPVTL